MLKFQIQEPNKLSNPEIQNQQNPTFKFKKSHPHFQTPNQKKKKKNELKNPLHKFKIEKLKKTLKWTYPWVWCTVVQMDNEDNKLALLIENLSAAPNQ